MIRAQINGIVTVAALCRYGEKQKRALRPSAAARRCLQSSVQFGGLFSYNRFQWHLAGTHDKCCNIMCNRLALIDHPAMKEKKTKKKNKLYDMKLTNCVAS